jgi:hypothetical protein
MTVPLRAGSEQAPQIPPANSQRSSIGRTRRTIALSEKDGNTGAAPACSQADPDMQSSLSTQFGPHWF